MIRKESKVDISQIPAINSNKFKIKKLDFRLTVLLFFIILVITACILLFFYHKQSISEIKQNHIRELKNKFIITISVYSNMADSIYELYLNNKEIKNIFAKGALSSNPKIKIHFRKQLLKKLSSLYQKITQYNFRQLHFHDLRNRSFLRFHRPAKFGDDLTGIRYSVEYVNREHKPISGFEEGRIFNGYRFLFPISFNNTHIGSVEISVSIKAVIQQLKKNFGEESQFIINKNQILKKIFKNELSNYSPWYFNSAYMLDKNISNSCFLKDSLSLAERKTFEENFKKHDLNGKPFCIEVIRDKKPILITFLPIMNFYKKPVAYLFSFSDSLHMQKEQQSFLIVLGSLVLLLILLFFFIFYYKVSQKKIVHLATYDSLTNTYTRGILFQKLEIELKRYQRYKKTFSLILIDLDYFKKINDSFGHIVGDNVLKKNSRIFCDNIRKSDSIGRYGGEEFIILLPETQIKAATIVAEKLRQTVNDTNFDYVGNVTISCGVSMFRENMYTVEEIIIQTDKRLYKAKETGRNTVVSNI